MAVTFTEITPDLLKEYIADLAKRNLSTATIASYIRPISALLSEAKDQEIIERSPFEMKRIRIPKTHVREKVVPSRDELQNVTQYVETEFAKDSKSYTFWQVFMFGCHTGLRFSDIALLTWKRVRDNKLEVTMQKTKTKKTYNLTPGAKELLAKLNRGEDSDYVFDIIDEKFDDDYNKMKIVRRCNIVGNAILQKISVALGRPYKLHFHQARSYFAVTWIKRNGNIAILQSILGHASIKTTQVYLKFADSDMDDEINRVFDY